MHQITEPEESEWIGDARNSLTSISMIICDGTSSVEKLPVFCIWNVSVLFELVACWMLRELASKGCAVEFDNTVTRSGTLS